MSILSPYVAYPDQLLGFRTTHHGLGDGTVVDLIRYVHIRFDKDGSIRRFAADTFVEGDCFNHELNLLDSYKLSRFIQRELSRLSDIVVSPIIASLPSLDREDYRLCFSWAGHPRPSAELSAKGLSDIIGDEQAARLMSARTAELAAMRYYRSLGSDVVDISKTQLESHNDGRWKDFDILVGNSPVDVKNARRNVNVTNWNSERNASGLGWYVEHQVPRFKQDRQSNCDVSIVGVLSDVLEPFEMELGLGRCVVLGEVSAGTVSNVRRWITDRFGKAIDFMGLWRPSYQPGWVFDYSPQLYRFRNEVIARIDTYFEEFLTPENIELVPGWLLVISKANPIVRNFTQLSPTAAKSLILSDLHELRDAAGYSRPALYIYAIAYLADALIRGERWEGSGAVLRDMLEVPNQQTILGLADPLSYLRGMFLVFEAVFDHVRRSHIIFTAFKLTHPSILRGKKASGGWVTLFAYCGGKIGSRFRRKCGNNPLFLGANDICPSCGFLICNRCGHCTDVCGMLEKRLQHFKPFDSPSTVRLRSLSGFAPSTGEEDPIPF